MLVMPHSSIGLCLDLLIFAILDLLDGALQSVGEGCAMQLDLAQSGIAATFQIRDHALDAVDLVNIRAERLGHDRIDGEAGRGEHTLDLACGFRVIQPWTRLLVLSRGASGSNTVFKPLCADAVMRLAFRRRRRRISQSRSTRSRTQISSRISAGFIAVETRARSSS
jgi:hypothetical protein